MKTKIYRVAVKVTCTRQYLVRARNKKEAKECFSEGDCMHESPDEKLTVKSIKTEKEREV